jgi:crotonobetainyl-CoA:carnitine CoA-transferase CaiB-like acyl-CoA transferase
MGPAFRLAHGEGGVRRAPPDLGGDTEAILHEVGYGDEEVATLRAEGAI